MPINSNIKKLNIIQICRWLMFPAPIVAIYYFKYGLTMKDLFMIQAVSSIMIAVFEIPTGYISDKFGRKKSLFYGLIISLLGFIIIGTSFGFTGFLIGEMFLGLGVTFISGSDSAILYETFKELNRTEDYGKAEAKFQSLHHLGEFAGVVIGGFIAAYSFRATYSFRSLFILIAIIAAYKLIEPTQAENTSEDKPKIWSSALTHTKNLWYIFGISAFIFAFMIIGFWYVQPILKKEAIPIIAFGVVFAVFKLVAFISARYSASITNKIKISGSIALMIFLIALGYTGICFFEGYIRLLFIIPFYIVGGLYMPIMNSALNQRIDSKSRATVLSINNLFGRLVFSILAPMVGFYSDINGMNATFLYISLIIVALGSILWIAFFIKNRNFNGTS
ncbi:MAG: MFS transporter [Candidatus Delongbacteria bacterium]|jgi:MFS family permease|nr:MFS transporter [Candidatus Delongbacteria bacterium]